MTETDMDQSLVTLLYGGPSANIVSIAGTAPGPVLILDAEGTSRLIRNRKKIIWNPLLEPVPVVGDWEICVVYCRDWQTYKAAEDYLVAGQHPFRSVVLSSLTELQYRCRKKIMSTDPRMTEQKWGVLLDDMSDSMRILRDTTTYQGNSTQVVIITAGAEKDDKGKLQPLVQGSLGKYLPYIVDVVGYVWSENAASGKDEDDRITVTPSDDIVARDLTRTLESGGITGCYEDGTVSGPISITEIIRTIYATEASE